jgi:hypothetical protein
MDGQPKIITVPSSASATKECAGNVLVSGSYGGPYNAFHAAKWGIRGVVLNDAGVGFADAGISGLPYLDRIGLPAATADAFTCHIGDGEDMLAHGTISHVNTAAAAIGCVPGQSVRTCAEHMLKAPIGRSDPPPIAGGKRYTIRDVPNEPKVICLDAAPMLRPDDAGAIAVTGSHAALFRGLPDDVIKIPLLAVFFNDAGVGKDNAGITRLADLETRGIASGAVSADSAPIGDSRAAYEHGVLSHVNRLAENRGARPGMLLRDLVAMLIEQTRQSTKSR